MQRKVVNIINFVRGIEPRMEVDLITPVLEEMKLNKKYGFENTFLLQYDAMTSSELVEIFKREKDEHMELGIWLEMARELVEKAGAVWTGRWDWDYHVKPGFLQAYTLEQKKKIIDLVMKKFYELFGYYPKSAGSWILDSDSMNYMVEKYGVEAICICRDQWGTDGYTLWGGYYNGPYYPSKNNMYIPAQTKEAQISAPVIRMLGPDPIYCYYERRREEGKLMFLPCEPMTLEPVCSCGHSENWVNWYFKNWLENEDMGMSYTQMGQENSFGWENIGKGLPMQMELLAKLEKDGKVIVEKMCDTGRRFREEHGQTPPSVYSALDDWTGTGRQSVWYSCKNYRLNLFAEDGQVRIRDFQKYDENYRDIYLDKPCEKNEAIYDALPMVDTLRFSDKEILAGIYFGSGKIERTWREEDKFLAEISADGKMLTMILTEDQVIIHGEADFAAKFAYKLDCEQIKELGCKQISYEHNGMKYALAAENGRFEEGAFVSENACLILSVL